MFIRLDVSHFIDNSSAIPVWRGAKVRAALSALLYGNFWRRAIDLKYFWLYLRLGYGLPRPAPFGSRHLRIESP